MTQSAAEIVFQGEHSRAICFNPQARYLMVRFEHRVTGKSGFIDPEHSAFLKARGFGQLNIQVARNDYYVNADLSDLRKCMRQFTQHFERVEALGFSMGGFGAVLLSKALRLNFVVLVSPQRLGFPQNPPFPMDPILVAPDMQDGGSLRYADVNPKLRGVVMFDPYFKDGRDQAYARVVKQFAPRLRLLALTGAGHPATQPIQEAKIYSRFQRAALARHKAAAQIRQLHRDSRLASDHYRQLIADYLEQRADRTVGSKGTENRLG